PPPSQIQEKKSKRRAEVNSLDGWSKALNRAQRQLPFPSLRMVSHSVIIQNCAPDRDLRYERHFEPFADGELVLGCVAGTNSPQSPE
ncbi:MAG: hypothetical protein KC931_23510, partial [Candidatus Omnitrophica bacterium]|nr:hypothetical protein [Candidatus Omnitrophota bacterium]